MKSKLIKIRSTINHFYSFCSHIKKIIINKKNDFYNSRLERVKMINRRSDFNQFAFHLSNPIMIFFRNIFLKLLTKNKNFLQSYLGKIYKN